MRCLDWSTYPQEWCCSILLRLSVVLNALFIPLCSCLTGRLRRTRFTADTDTSIMPRSHSASPELTQMPCSFIQSHSNYWSSHILLQFIITPTGSSHHTHANLDVINRSKKKKKTCEKYWNKAPFTPPATLSLYVASLCTVKLLVGVSNAVALILLVDFTSGHIYRKYNYK